MAAAQLCGEDFLVGLDCHRADAAGQALTRCRDWRRRLPPVWPGLTLRLPPGDNHLLAEVLARLHTLPHPP